MVELHAEEALAGRLLDVVATVDGKEELVDETSIVSLLPGAGSIIIFLVGLGLSQYAPDQPGIIVVAGEAEHLVLHKDVAPTHRSMQTNALQGGATGERHVGLATRKGSMA